MVAPSLFYRPKHDRQRVVSEAWATAKAMVITGPAGTGKTTCALALSLIDILAKRADKVWLCRPAVPVEEDLGFIPGDLVEKLRPWLAPFEDVLDGIGGGSVERWEDAVEVVSIGQLGGRTVRSATLIIDECQNATWRQLKMALTRVGPGGRVVLCGDYTQTELPHPNPLESVAMKLAGMPDVTCVEFLPEDQQRDPFVRRVLEALR